MHHKLLCPIFVSFINSFHLMVNVMPNACNSTANPGPRQGKLEACSLLLTCTCEKEFQHMCNTRTSHQGNINGPAHLPGPSKWDTSWLICSEHQQYEMRKDIPMHGMCISPCNYELICMVLLES
jgi:hypothetical protein